MQLLEKLEALGVKRNLRGNDIGQNSALVNHGRAGFVTGSFESQ